MADNHCVDPGDQTGAAEGVSDHSDLSTLYAEVKKEHLSPWMHEDERQASLEYARRATVAGLRTSVGSVGLAMGLPISLALVGWMFFSTSINRENAVPMFFFILVSLGLYIALIYKSLTWTAETFRTRTLKASPVMATILASLILAIKPSLEYAARYVSDFNVTLLGATIVLGVSLVLSAALVLLWSIARIPAIIKALVLLFVIAAAVTAGHL